MKRIDADRVVGSEGDVRVADGHAARIAVEPDDDMCLRMCVRDQVARCIHHRHMPEPALEELDRGHCSSLAHLRVLHRILVRPTGNVKRGAPHRLRLAAPATIRPSATSPAPA